MNARINSIEVKYTKKIVAFLDVLGFKRIVDANSTKKLSQYYSTVTEQLKSLKKYNSKEPLQYTIVSDSIVLAFPWECSTDNFREFSIAVAKIQLNLARIGIFIRGGIAVGDFYYNEDGNIFVGPGFVKAYELEVAHAIVPRVVIHPSVFKEAKLDRGTFIDKVNNVTYDSIWKGPVLSEYFNIGLPNSPYFNDAIFIDYFAEINSMDGQVHEEIYEALKKEIYDSQDHLPKYDWILRYLIGKLEPSKTIYKKLEFL